MVLETNHSLPYQPPHAPRRGIGGRTRQRHLAARAYCAPRKWSWRPITACLTSRRTPPGGALAGAPGSGTLPHALIVRRVNGLGDQSQLALPAAARPPRRGIGGRTRQRRFAALSTFPASPATVVFCRRYRLSMYIIPENHRNAQTIKPSSLAQIRNPPGRYHASFPSKRISHSRRKREGVIPVFC